LDDLNSRLEEGGLVWQQYLQPHVERIELVLDTLLGRRLDRLLSGGKITTAQRMPKTIPVLNFRPEDWPDTVPCGFDSFAPDTPEAERTKLYYMLYNIAGKKLVGEVSTVPYAPTHAFIPLYLSDSIKPSGATSYRPAWPPMAPQVSVPPPTAAKLSSTSRASSGSARLMGTSPHSPSPLLLTRARTPSIWPV
jgi:hypothetical protein